MYTCMHFGSWYTCNSWLGALYENLIGSKVNPNLHLLSNLGLEPQVTDRLDSWKGRVQMPKMKGPLEPGLGQTTFKEKLVRKWGSKGSEKTVATPYVTQPTVLCLLPCHPLSFKPSTDLGE